MLKLLILAIEVFLLILFIMPLPIINPGNIAGMVICSLLIAATIFNKPFFSLLKTIWTHGGAGRGIMIASVVFVTACVLYAGVLSFKMYKAMSNAPEKTDLIVVLGCQVRGETPSRMLRHRLDTAYGAMQKHPDALCVVSGGKGSDELISEAEAMRRYLVAKGADESRIVMEDKSTNTFENIKFSFEITDKLGYDRDITIVTDGYHQYRAGLIARKQGAENVTSYSAPTEFKFQATYWVREWMGLSRFFVLGR
ncbi:MAG: YdcF family protein [Oscillospiraceae bacterium]|nr:YdcF family protein [Oscillospiraceae bacterium]